VPFVTSDTIESADVLVDAIFGIGLNKPIEGVYKEIIQSMNQSGKYVFSVDCPSGVDCTSGKILGIAVNANETITFGVNKLGMVLYPGANCAGEISVADIGFPHESVANISGPAYIYESEDIGRVPARPDYSNKGTFGKVLVVAGSETMSGACYLAAKAAYVMGAGLVKVVTSCENRNVILSSLPEVLFSTYDDLAQGMDWASVIVAGPGLGRSERTKSIIGQVLKETEKSVIIDGDGLYYARDYDCHPNVILTPHLKEMTYLNKATVSQIQEDLLESAIEQANERNCVIALKDARTIVTNGRQVYVNVTGNNGMATGGCGDVLAGTVAGLLAQKMKPFEAAKLGVFVHGMAGDCMIKDKGKYGLLASDLLEGLVKITSQLV
jgi:NAD(P)H-hydrate epimerase